MKSPEPLIRVAIVSYGMVEPLLDVLQEVQSQNMNCQIMVWDNYSTNSEQIRSVLTNKDGLDWVHFSQENIGFGRAVNKIAGIPGEWDSLLLVNPDAVISGSLQQIIDLVSETGVGAAGAWIDSPDCQPWDNVYADVGPFFLAFRALAGRRRSSKVSPELKQESRRITGWIEGSLLAISRSAWNEVGAFDEQFFLYSEEQDWQRRARLKGWEIRQWNQILAKHQSLGTVRSDHLAVVRSLDLQEESRRLYIHKWWGPSGLTLYRVTLGAGNRVKSITKKLQVRLT